MTDSFTTAATAEARRESPLYDNEVLSYGVRMAEWARDHLAAQEPTAAEVEAAALTLCEMEGDDPDDMALYRDQARAALTAAKEDRA